MLLNIILPILSAIGLALLCQVLGWSWVNDRKLGLGYPGFGAAIDVLLSAFGVGLWLMSIATMLWGMGVGLEPWKIWTLLGGLAWFGRRSIIPVLRAYRNTWRAFRLTRAETLGATGFFALIFIGLGFALVPPLFNDTVRYHFGVPHRWIADGMIRKLPNFSEQHLVMMWQHAAMILLALGQPSGAKVFCFIAFPATLAAVGLCARRFYVGGTAGPARLAPVFAVTMLATTPTFFGNTVLGGPDGGVAFFTAMALLFLFRDPRFGIRNYLWAGAMAGLAMSSKWQGALAVVGVVGVALARGGWREGRRLAGVMLLAAGIAFLPWGLRNLFWSGDPFYPFFGRFYDAAAHGVYERIHGLLSGYGLSGVPVWQWALYPLHVTFGALPFWFGGKFQFESEIGPLYLISLPLIIISAVRGEKRVRALLLFAVLALALGGWMGQLPRYWMPAWVALAVAAGAAAARLGRRGRTAALIVLAFSAVLNLLTVTAALDQDSFAPLKFFWTGARPGVLYADTQPEWRASKWLISKGSKGRILLAGLEGQYYWGRGVWIDGPFDDKLIVGIAEKEQTPEGIAARLKDQGFEFIVLDSGRGEKLERQFGYMGWDPSTRKLVRKFLETQIIRVHRDGNVQVGQIR